MSTAYAQTEDEPIFCINDSDKKNIFEIVGLCPENETTDDGDLGDDVIEEPTNPKGPIFCITTPCEQPASPGFFWQLRTFLEDKMEQAVPTLRTHFGESERKSVLTDLKDGVVVAQERIDRVEEKLGDSAIKDLAEVNDLNKVYNEFLEVEQIQDKALQKQKAIELDSKVNSMEVVQEGCEKPIRTMDILKSENYYETLRNDFCNKTLKDIDVNTAKSYLGL